MFCITITDLRSLTFNVGEINRLHHTPNESRYGGSKWNCGFMRRQSQLSVSQPCAKRSPGQQVSVKLE